MTRSQRDAFWQRIYALARSDRDVIIVSADMGAPALDDFRRDLPAQFINVGIAEQQAVLLSAGMALTGKKVFVYAIAPFITLRVYEQIKVELAAMNLPLTLVGVGAGFSYDDSGPTHHCVEDLSIMRILPNLKIHNVSDSVMADAFAQITYAADYPAYVRLDREELTDIYNANSDFSMGVNGLKPGKDLLIVATGNMVRRALEVAAILEHSAIAAGVMDLHTLPINADHFIPQLDGVEKLVTLEEHSLPGGLGSAVCELLCDAEVFIPIKRFGLNFQNQYCYRYGGRNNLQRHYGLDVESLAQGIRRWLER